MKTIGMVAVFAAGVLAAVVIAAPSAGANPSRAAIPAIAACSSGYVDAIIGGEHKCLHAGEFCSAAHESDYEHYGYTCVNGRLQSGAPAPAAVTTTTLPATTALTTTVVTTTPSSPPIPTPTIGKPGPSVGKTVLLKPRKATSGCKLGALPDRRCSPGAYSSGLAKAVICSPNFRTSGIRKVPTSEKHAVEAEYGLAPKSYGRSLEIDHIVSLELGGSNDIANLFPEKASFANHQPGFRVKDKLENAAHDAVCNGTISLSYAQHQIAANWELLYKKLFGVAPTG